MFGQKESAALEQPLLESEARYIAHLNRESYEWLGSRYAWYNKIRNAKKGMALFREHGLEEQMEATRSALSLVGKTLNTGLALAYNSVVDSVVNRGAAPEGWPEKIDAGDRSAPPALTEEQDALIIAWMPLKFLNLAKAVRDKGKGLDYYVDGLVKKLTFKVVGYYCEPSHWDSRRLAYFLQGLDEDTGLQEVQSRLSALKSEVDLFTGTYQLFRFGRARGANRDPQQKNTLEETFEITDQELLNDLYFQSFLVSGMEHFVFRYYLTLLSATRNPWALKQLSAIFEPLLGKTEEVHLRFTASFAMEKEKQRLRQDYSAFSKTMEARPPVETVEEKGRKTRRINYTHRLLEALAYARSGQFTERQAQTWRAYLEREVIQHLDGPRGYLLLLEVLNTLVMDTQSSMDGKLKVAATMRQFADEQERLGRAQIAQKKRLMEEQRRKKMREVAKFRAQEQANMVEVVQQEVARMEEDAAAELERVEQAIVKRREAQIARVEQLESLARQDREKNLGKNAANVWRLAQEADAERKLRTGIVPMLVHYIQEDKDTYHDLLYRHLFGVIDGLFPTEKMVLRSAVAQKLSLGENDLPISEEEMADYQQQLEARKAELNQEVPGVMEQKLIQGPVAVTVEQLLNMDLTAASLRLLFQLQFAGPNKPGAKLPGAVVKRLLIINQLAHPLPQNDISLPNVEGTAPPLKQINFNRLQKLMT